MLSGVDAADAQTSGAASGVEIASPNVTVANLSLQGFRDTAITISEGASAPHLSNVVVSDSAHLIRIESSALGTSSQGIIERSRFTASSGAQVLDGIAITGGKGWVVRGNRFEGIRPLEPNGGTVRVDGNATARRDRRQSVLREPARDRHRDARERAVRARSFATTSSSGKRRMIPVIEARRSRLQATCPRSSCRTPS